MPGRHARDERPVPHVLPLSTVPNQGHTACVEEEWALDWDILIWLAGLMIILLGALCSINARQPAHPRKPGSVISARPIYCRLMTTTTKSPRQSSVWQARKAPKARQAWQTQRGQQGWQHVQSSRRRRQGLERILRTSEYVTEGRRS